MLTKELLIEYNYLKDKYGSSAVIKDPIFIDNFLDEQTFKELKHLCRTRDAEFMVGKEYFSPNMFKTEQGFKLEGKIQSIVEKKVKEIYDSENLISSFNVYAVHKNPEQDSPKPVVAEHLDRNKATYIVDLILHADFDWPIVVHDKVYHPKENQAILFHPEDQLHYRTEWDSNNNQDLYEVAFFHYIEPDHWSLKLKTVDNEDFSPENQIKVEQDNSELQRYFELKKLVAAYKKYRAGLYEKLPPLPTPPFRPTTIL